MRATPLRAALALCLAAALLPAGEAAAEGPIVLFGDELDAQQAGRLVKDTLGIAEFQVQGPLSAEVGGNPSSTATVVFGARPKRCEVPQKTGRPLGGVVVFSREQIFNMSYPEAIERLDAAAEALPCNADDAETDHLYDLFFLRGFSHFAEGREGEARRSFSQAAAIDPSRPWNNDYPPTPKATYLAALQNLLESEPAPLRVEVGDLVVDGRKVERGRPQTIRPGSHLVRAGEDVLWVEVPPEGDRPITGVVVTTVERLTAGLRKGDDAYGPWLLETADANGWTDVVLVTEEAVLTFDGTTLTPHLTAAGLRAAPPPPTRVAGIVMAGAGAAAAGVGLGLHFGSWAEAKPGPDGSALMPQGDYEGYVVQNRVGFGLAIGGAAVTAAGIVLALIPPKPPAGAAPTARRDAPRIAPWAVGSSEGFVLGVAGRLP